MPLKTRERPGCNPGAPKTTLSHQPSATATSVAPSSSDTLEAALDYLARGWSILPLKPGRKEPAGWLLEEGQWKPLSVVAATEDDVLRWLELCPNMNLGIIAGEVSQQLALIDIDYGDKPNSNGLTMPEALREFVESLDTPAVWTSSGGVHIYTRSPGQLHNDTLDLVGTRVELQAETRYCAAPPSVYAGTAYRWAEPIGDTTPQLPPLKGVLGELGALFALLPAASALRSRTTSTSSKCKKAAKERKPASKPRAEHQRASRGLERWDADLGFVRAFIDLLDIGTEVNEKRGTSTKFCCVLHPEQNPSASLFKTRNGVWVYADYHQHDGRPVYPLVDVYARVRHNVRRRLTRNQRAAWKLRLLADTENLPFSPSDPELPRLPDDLSRDGLALLAGFRLLQALQWSYRPEWRGNPTSFARDFAARWCGLPERRFDRARWELVEKGLLVPVGELSKVTTTKKGEERERKMKLFNLPAYADTNKEG